MIRGLKMRAGEKAASILGCPGNVQLVLNNLKPRTQSIAALKLTWLLARIVGLTGKWGHGHTGVCVPAIVWKRQTAEKQSHNCFACNMFNKGRIITARYDTSI
jgi:hypothetical protein